MLWLGLTLRRLRYLMPLFRIRDVGGLRWSVGCGNGFGSSELRVFAFSLSGLVDREGMVLFASVGDLLDTTGLATAAVSLDCWAATK